MPAVRASFAVLLSPLTRRADEAALLAALRESLALHYGDAALGAALASLQVKYFNPRTGLAVVRCGREECASVQACVARCTSVKGRKAKLSVLRRSGTLRACVKAARTLNADALRALAAGARGVNVESALKEGDAALDLLEP